MATLLVIGIFAALLYLIQMLLFRRLWDKNLEVEVRFGEPSAISGQDSTLVETITNRKWFPIPVLHVKFQIDRHLLFRSMSNARVSDQLYKNDVFSLLFYQRITRTIPFHCERRGYYRITQTDTVASNLFFTGNLVHLYSQDTELYVYPEPISTQALEIPFRRMMGELATKRFLYQDPFSFQGIREYTIQDPMKAVNWKASARSGSLKTNTYEYTAGQEICMLVNLEDESVWHQERLLEVSISLAASLAVRFLNAGIPVSIYTNGLDIETGIPVSIAHASGVAQIEQINRQLARINLDEKPVPFGGLAKQLSEERERHQDACMMVLSYSRHQETDQQIHDLAAVYPGLYWILPVYPEEEALPSESQNRSVLKWEVSKSYV